MQSGFRHCVHRERCSESFDIKNIGRGWILRPCAGPQEALRISTSVVDAMPARRTEQVAGGFVRSHSDGYPELMIQFTRSFPFDCGVPATDKDRGYRPDIGSEPSFDAPFDSPKKRLGRRQILVARK